MRWISKGATGLVMVALAAGAVVALYGRSTLPQTNGELKLEGLRHPVQVRRDASDVTHILAQDPRDAWMALGYAHAQEGPWQMEFNRRVMRGRLSEVLGQAVGAVFHFMETYQEAWADRTGSKPPAV